MPLVSRWSLLLSITLLGVTSCAVEDVAQEMGVDVASIESMVERGRVLSGGTAKQWKREPEGETQEQRTQRFIEDMRSRRSETR